jgi:hypothetical protein
MTAAFDHAATRHWSDARLLEDEGRLPNADHLFGLAAECAIKSALVQLSELTPGGELAAGYQEHIEKLWDHARLHGFQRTFPNLQAVLRLPNPFDDWKVDQRYERGNAVTVDVKNRHRDAAKRVLGAVRLLGASFLPPTRG